MAVRSALSTGGPRIGMKIIDTFCAFGCIGIGFGNHEKERRANLGRYGGAIKVRMCTSRPGPQLNRQGRLDGQQRQRTRRPLRYWRSGSTATNASWAAANRRTSSKVSCSFSDPSSAPPPRSRILAATMSAKASVRRFGSASRSRPPSGGDAAMSAAVIGSNMRNRLYLVFD